MSYKAFSFSDQFSASVQPSANTARCGRHTTVNSLRVSKICDARSMFWGVMLE